MIILFKGPPSPAIYTLPKQWKFKDSDEKSESIF